MVSRNLEKDMVILVNGLKHKISLVMDYSPTHITVFTYGKCQMTFNPDADVELIKE